MKNVYFFTDIHGHYQLFSAIINWCKKQSNQYQIIYGGDAADRGENGYKIIKELLVDPNIIYLYGNHEELFVHAADSIIGSYASSDEAYNFLISCDENQASVVINEMRSKKEEVLLYIYNGGESTLKDWLLDQANFDIIDRLRFLPRVYTYNNLDFCHAGSTYLTFKEGYKKPIPKHVEQALIWDRNCIPMGWEKDRIGVFGHTPTVFLPSKIYGRNTSIDDIHPCMWGELMGGKHKRGGYKIDMDTGAYATNKSYVLDCNTLQTYCFQYDPKTQQTTITEYKLERP